MSLSLRASCLLSVGLVFSPAPQAACSDTPFIGSICLVAFNFCPRGYADAAGQLLPIAQNQALFALLGTQYGGNGQTTFALPDLRGRAPIGSGQGPGLAAVVIGEVLGQENVSLQIAQLPAHSHAATLRGGTAAGTSDSPANAAPARLARSNIYGAATDTPMASGAVSIASTGNGQPVPVRDPALGMQYCIALQGIFPSRN